MATSLPIFYHSMVFILLSHCANGLISNNRKLIVISFDAFKPAYLEKNITPFFETFYREGVRATRMNNVFPTKTFVNHFSIATGLYPQNHGVTGNEVYDLKTNQFYKYSYELFHYNESVIPIWRLNEDRGGSTGVMMWPGSDFAYQKKKCNLTMSLDMNMALEDRADVVMKWLKGGANFVMFYIEQPDDEGHAYGPDSKEEMDMVKRLDSFIVYLEQLLIMEDLEDITDIIILSDHGMLTVKTSHFIDLYTFIDKNQCKTYGSSPVLQVICNNGKHKEACNNLTTAAKSEQMTGKFNAYIDEELYERWHVRNQQRFGPCSVVAEPDYAFQDMYEFAEWFNKEKNVSLTLDTPYGVHGYDNNVPSMQPIFMAKGPSFNGGITIDDGFSNIDLYHLFCKLLKIDCIPVDGIDRQEIWKKMLKDGSTNKIHA